MIDTTLNNLLEKETNRLNNDIELIASENYPSKDILNLMGTVFSVKYAEGYPGNRHYAGCDVIDEVETFAIKKACELFNVNYANVQPFSGSHANTCVYHAFCKPHDVTLSMSLNSGAHLTHGSKFTYSGRFYDHKDFELIDEKINYNEIKQKLYEYKPRLLIMGYSAYPGRIDFQKVREIVDEYNSKIFEECIRIDITVAEELFKNKKCILWTDMAHFAGFIAAHIWEDKYDPTKWSDVVTTTTHKTLRGPRSAIILWNEDEYTKKINAACFPGNAGGPNEAAVAAKAQCFIEALKPEYKVYMQNVASNMQALINGVKSYDKNSKLRFVMNGSENHLALIDLKGANLLGSDAERILKSYGIICNKNMIAGDTKPSLCTGIRIGTAAVTTRGFTEDMCYKLGELIAKILLTKALDTSNETIDLEEAIIRKELKDMIKQVGDFYKK